jgi:hypothetical protein
MAVEIKSGNSTDLATVEPTSKSMRVTNYNSEGIEGFQSLPIALNVADVSAINNDLLSSFDVEKYKFVSLQLAGTWVGTVSFQGSNDNGTFYPVATSDPSGGLTTGDTSATSNRIVKIPTIFKYLRVRVTAYSSGTVEGIAFGHRDENSSGLIAALGPITIASGPTPTYQKFISTTTTNATAVSSVPANISILHMVNKGDGVRFFKLYNKATAPTVGTDVPLITIGIPPVSSSSFLLPALVGIDFSIGISFAITLGAADSDTQVLTVAADVTGLIAYAAL